MIKFVYGILPVVLKYSDNMPQPWIGGYAKGPYIRLRTKYKGTDEGILQHELTHVKQWYRSLMYFHPILYLVSKRYRLWSEVEAYKVQSNYYDDPAAKLKRFAKFISTRYNLAITEKEALRRLSN